MSVRLSRVSEQVNLCPLHVDRRITACRRVLQSAALLDSVDLARLVVLTFCLIAVKLKMSFVSFLRLFLRLISDHYAYLWRRVLA